MAHPINDLTGLHFGRLTVLLASSRRTTRGQVYWRCLCDCGCITEATGGNLRSGSTTSCGCYRLEVYAARGKREGAYA